ncbi:MAG: hypothetical protein E6R05_04700 [Candidatus Moraniibacteriota bacterium]|nr:MAG: hypothetical protein E6R05_04700 [Candidatus Moranbacteria bacterium]
MYMKSIQPVSEPWSIKDVILVRDYIVQKLISDCSPFCRPPVWRRVVVRMTVVCVKFFEWLVGAKLYVQNELRELFDLDPRLRTLLLKLVQCGIIASWTRTSQRPDVPPMVQFAIQLSPIQIPPGRQFSVTGSAGGGTGYTADEALLKSIAEALERYSLSVIDFSHMVIGSYRDLGPRRAIQPEQFCPFSQNQIEQPEFARHRISQDIVFGWVKSKELVTHTERFIPAQTVYLSYGTAFPEDPVFLGASTNGAAAGSSYDAALYRALCEAIERDGLLIFWLNTLAPPRINLESITIPKVQEQIAILKKYKFNLTILDITTDLNLPSFAAVLTDSFGEIAVSISAVADFDIPRAFEKLMLEILKFPHFKKIEREGLSKVNSVYNNAASSIDTIADRRGLWSSQTMRPRIDFFLNGPVKSYRELQSPIRGGSYREKNQYIVKMLAQKQYSCFVVDVTASEARDAGLIVVKVVIPDLVPLYFHEYQKPLGINRLYSVPVLLGYRSNVNTEKSLNQIPHPFL